MREDIIYHYCNMESFYGIVKNKNIRLSNAYKTNDCYELEWIFNVMEKSLSDRLEGGLIRSIKKSYREWVEDYFSPHIACFSKDGDLLSQWRGYANDGQGVSIGFDRKYFESTKRLENKEYEIRDVVYKSKEQERLLQKMFSSESDFLKQLKDFYTNKGENKHIGEMMFMGRLLKYGMTFKSEGFSEEKEVRLIHGFDELAAEPDMFKYRVTANDFISFIEIPLNIESDYSPIKKVVLGPKCKASPKDMGDFIFKNLRVDPPGIDIKRSNSSYR